MKSIRIKAVKEGMRVGKNVCDRSGRLLFAAGTLLEKRHLRILKSWGITELDISTREDVNSEEEQEIETEFFPQAAGIIEERFRFNDKELAVVIELKKILQLRLARALANEQ